MLERVAQALTRFSTRHVPDAYVIAGVLSVLVFGIALLVSDKGALDLVGYWGDGFWGFIPFTLQMAMVILTGFVVADSPPVVRCLSKLASWPSTPRRAIALAAVVSMGLAWINWGLSIVASALLAKRIAGRKIGVDYRLLVATAYLGLGCMWHAGLSASAPLTSSDPSQAFVKNYLKAPVPVSSTLFSPFNLVLALLVLVVMTLLAVAMHPKKPVPMPETGDPEDGDEPVTKDGRPTTPAEWLERTPWVNLVVALAVFVYLPMFVTKNGFRRININHVNLLFFGASALLHWTPASLLRSAERGGRHVWGVLLQFGLYAGVAGILDKSGLASHLADAFTTVSSPKHFPLLVVWYSGILNYLVPSGGAKWFIEVQYLADAAHELGVPMGDTILAYAWGDMFTDIIQPFWAIPLLAVARLGFRDIMGYCLVFFLAYAALVSGAFLAWGILG
ncbi:MAG: short-chain fatty acid transporter [Deltaproteobacteria bacterium]|nr:short-chain fatty acid transporter [Deltaproteobacteria bacterium]